MSIEKEIVKQLLLKNIEEKPKEITKPVNKNNNRIVYILGLFCLLILFASLIVSLLVFYEEIDSEPQQKVIYVPVKINENRKENYSSITKNDNKNDNNSEENVSKLFDNVDYEKLQNNCINYTRIYSYVKNDNNESKIKESIIIQTDKDSKPYVKITEKSFTNEDIDKMVNKYNKVEIVEEKQNTPEVNKE